MKIIFESLTNDLSGLANSWGERTECFRMQTWLSECLCVLCLCVLVLVFLLVVRSWHCYFLYIHFFSSIYCRLFTFFLYRYFIVMIIFHIHYGVFCLFFCILLYLFYILLLSSIFGRGASIPLYIWSLYYTVCIY